MSAESDLIFTNPDPLFFHELSNGTELLSRGSGSAVSDFDAEILQTAAGIAPYNGISIPAMSGMLFDSIQGADLMASLGDDDQLLGPLSPPPEIMNEGGFSQTNSTCPLLSASDEDIKPATGLSSNPTVSASVASSPGVGDISAESPLSPFIRAKMGLGSPHSNDNGAERMRTGFGMVGGEGRGDLRGQRRIVQQQMESAGAVIVRGGPPLYVNHSYATSPGRASARAETPLVSSLQDVYMSRAADGGIECLLSPTTSGQANRGGGAAAGSAGRPPPSFVVGGMSHGGATGRARGSSPASSPPGRAAIMASERLSDLSLEQQHLRQLHQQQQQQQQQRAGGGAAVGGGGGAYAGLGAMGMGCAGTESGSTGRGGGGGGSAGCSTMFDASKLRMQRGATGILQKSASFAGLSNGTTTPSLRRIGSLAPVNLQEIMSAGSISVDSGQRLRPGESLSPSLQQQHHNGGGGGLSSFFGANGCCGAAYDLATSMGRTSASYTRVSGCTTMTIPSVTGVKQEDVQQQGGGGSRGGGGGGGGGGEECDMVEGEGNDAGGGGGGGVLTRAGSFSTSVTPPSPSGMSAAAAAAAAGAGASSPTTCSAGPAHSLGSVSCAMEEMRERLDEGFVSSSSGSGALDCRSSSLSGAQPQRSSADKSPARLVMQQGSFAARGNPPNHVREEESSMMSAAGTSGGIDSGGDCLRPLRLSTQRGGGGGGMSAMQRSHSSHALGQLRTLAPAPSIPEATLPSFSRLMPLEQTSSRIGSSGGNLQPKLSDLQNLTSRPIMPAFGMRRVHSAGDIQTLNGMHVAMGGLHSLGDRGALEDGFRIGRYTMEERKKRINRYRQKRSERNFNKKIKYACRKTLADSRPRVRGRFARNDEVEVGPGIKSAPAKGQEDEHHEDDDGDEDDESPDMLVDEELDDDILLGPESGLTELLSLPNFKFDCGRTTSA